MWRGCEQGAPPLTWSCMMQLDSQRSAPPKQPAAMAPAASPAPSPRSSQQKGGPLPTCAHTHTHTHCPQHPTSWFVRCAPCASYIPHACPSPRLRQVLRNEPPFLPEAAILRITCVSQRLALSTGLEFARSGAQRASACICTFYFTGSHVRSASSAGEKRCVSLFP